MWILLWTLVDQRALINHHAGFVVLAAILIFLEACSPPEERELAKGFSFEKEKDFKSAVAAFNRTLLRAPQSPAALIAAKEGSKIALLELKDFKKTTEFDRFIVLQSPIVEDRIAAQKQLASVYFDQLSDYPHAIEELNKLLYTVATPDEKDKVRIKLAKAYFYTNNFFQAESEATDFLQMKHDEDSIFQMMVLKGNIYVAKKDMQKAIETFRYILDKYPEKAVKENAAMTLAVAYEEMKDYKNAIDVLEKMKPFHASPEYIDLRIKKLQINQKNQPGAKGTRKK